MQLVTVLACAENRIIGEYRLCPAVPTSLQVIYIHPYLFMVATKDTNRGKNTLAKDCQILMQTVDLNGRVTTELSIRTQQHGLR